MKIKRNNGGYIALISAILISVSLLVMVVAVSFEGFYSRFSVLESEQKEISAYLAESCVNTAILKISQNEDYTGGETILIGGHNCKIVNVDKSGSFNEKRIIQTQGSMGAAFTNLQVQIDYDELPTVDIESWVELAEL